MKIYNSAEKAVQEFKPLHKGLVNLYVCGLTPYDSAHIGHARAYVAFDVIKRYLLKKGFRVYHIQNITDVEDKIIKRCLETGSDPKKLTESVNREAMELFDELNILRADIYPKVTEHIPEIISIVEKLIRTTFAYETETGIYFDVSKFKNYGRLSGQNPDELKSGSRKEIDESKRNPIDFALWKKSKGEILEFDSPWGKGRPGWHIECSAMAVKYAGSTLDIHGGARDLIFPHHENEIAQSEAATGKPFVRFWVHAGFLTVDGEKMSKSLGNFTTLKESLQNFSPNAHRMFFIHSHYRSPVDYDKQALGAAGESAERILNSLGLMAEAIKEQKNKKDAKYKKESDKLIRDFYSAMDNDFDTPSALSALFSLLRITNAQIEKPTIDREQVKKVESAVREFTWIFGFKEPVSKLDDKLDALQKLASGYLPEATGKTSQSILECLIEERDSSRKKKDFRKSDQIRDSLNEIGIILEDKEGKTRWKLK